MADIRELILKNVFNSERFKAVESRLTTCLAEVVGVGPAEDTASISYLDPLTGTRRLVHDVPVNQIRGLPPMDLQIGDVVLVAFSGGSASVPQIIASLTLQLDYERAAGGERQPHYLGAV